MRNLRRLFLEQVAQWDAPTKTALTIAVILLAIMFGVYGFGGESLRVPSVVAIATLIFVAQAIVLWGNRRMVTPFTQAQRLYLNGEIDKAQNLLESRRSSDDVDIQELTLLGNIYRQMGDLQRSEKILLEALNISPEHHFPLYGLGRTKLSNGEYDAAVQYITQALEVGAPLIINVDLAEAYHRMGEREQALHVLDKLNGVKLEPYRLLMVAWVRNEQPSAQVIGQGLPYWQQTAERFAHTPYGQALAQDIESGA